MTVSGIDCNKTTHSYFNLVLRSIWARTSRAKHQRGRGLRQANHEILRFVHPVPVTVTLEICLKIQYILNGVGLNQKFFTLRFLRCQLDLFAMAFFPLQIWSERGTKKQIERSCLGDTFRLLDLTCFVEASLFLYIIGPIHFQTQSYDCEWSNQLQ